MNDEKDRGEVVLYQPNDAIRLEVRLDQETVWLTQQQIAMLMGTNIPAISKHIGNIYSSQELDKSSTVSKMEIVRLEGDRFVKRSVDHYNLDMIISVGYRVNSVNATAFRRWATSVLKQHLLRGYSINQQLMQMEDRHAGPAENRHDGQKIVMTDLLKIVMPDLQRIVMPDLIQHLGSVRGLRIWSAMTGRSARNDEEGRSGMTKKASHRRTDFSEWDLADSNC